MCPPAATQWSHSCLAIRHRVEGGLYEIRTHDLSRTHTLFARFGSQGADGGELGGVDKGVGDILGAIDKANFTY
jgi:hypothetical protein